MDALTESEKAKATSLVEMGLPEAQAILSAQDLAKGTTPSPNPCSVSCMLKVKESADMAALKDAFTKYSAASKTAPGKVHAAYSISEDLGELNFIEIFDSPAAMNCHVGMCFEHYVKMVPHMEMSEIVASCDASEVDWWKSSASAWGAQKLVVNPVL